MSGRYYQRDFEELYYIIDSEVISEEEFDERVDYDGYSAFEDSMAGEEIIDLLNENDELKHQVNCLQDRLDDIVPVTREVTQCHCDLAEQIRENKELRAINKVLESEHSRLQEQVRLMDCSEVVTEQKELQGLIYQVVGNLIDEKIKECDTRECDCCRNCIGKQLLGELKKELPIK